MVLRPFLYSATSCASYLFGCMSHGKLAVVDPHVELVDDYLATAAALGSPITAVFETHVQADHVSGLPALVEQMGATAYLPAGTGVDFDHVALADGDIVELVVCRDERSEDGFFGTLTAGVPGSLVGVCSDDRYQAHRILVS